MKAVIIGIASFIIVGCIGYYLSTTQRSPTPTPQSSKIQVNQTITPQNTPTTNNTMRTYENNELGIAFEYPSMFTIDANKSLRRFDTTKDNVWKLTLYTTGKEQLTIDSDAPPDWPDCRKIIYKKDIVTNVTITLHRETFDDIADCKSDTPYTGWYALAKRSTSTWFLSLSTDSTDKQYIEELDTNFEKLVRSFRTI